MRRALDDQDGRRYLVTVSGRGYQFVADVRTVAADDSATPAAAIHAETGSAIDSRLEPNHQRPATASESPRPPPSRDRVLRALVASIVAATVLALGLYVIGAARGPAGGGADRGASAARILPNSVAVLPFRNLSPNEDDAYFAAGLHEQVLDKLAKIRALTVIARTSVMGYVGAARPLSEIAAELHVGTVLEGSASRAGDRVRVSVQLVDPATNALLWSEVYDGSLSDVFAIQADIATRIAAALESELSPRSVRISSERRAESLEAYALYLRALALFREGGGIGPGMPDTTRTALQSYLDQAIALDPGFAAAYVRVEGVRLRRLAVRGPRAGERLGEPPG